MSRSGGTINDHGSLGADAPSCGSPHGREPSIAVVDDPLNMVGLEVMVWARVRSVHASGGEPWLTLQPLHDTRNIFAAPVSDTTLECPYVVVSPPPASDGSQDDGEPREGEAEPPQTTGKS